MSATVRHSSSPGHSLKKQKLLHKIKAQRKFRKQQQNSVSFILRKINVLGDAFKYTEALEVVKEGLRVHPNNLQLLETGGIIALEIGEADLAYAYFTKAVTIAPNRGSSKYLYLGQLSSGTEAIDYLLKGIELLTKEGQACACCSSGDDVSLKISSAYCSIAEIYLTDECFSATADGDCLKYCQLAMSSCPSNPEGHIVMASYLLSVGKKEEAKKVLCDQVDTWLDPLESNGSSTNPLPSYESRVNCVKLLLEVKALERAKSVLEGLVKEDDEVISVWYLLGWCLYLAGKKKSAKIHFAKVIKLNEKYTCDDEEMIEHCKELLLEEAEERTIEEGEEETTEEAEE